jgi:GNAT superfamily N-acetyltransferase
MKTLKNNRVVDAYLPDGQAVVLRIWVNERNTDKLPVGSVVVFSTVDCTQILHIYVEKPYRRKGYASDLVRELQVRHPYIITGWTGSESAARDMLLKMGFKHNQLTDVLEWISPNLITEERV